MTFTLNREESNKLYIPYLTDDVGIIHPTYKKILGDLFYSYRKIFRSLIPNIRRCCVSNTDKFERFENNYDGKLNDILRELCGFYRIAYYHRKWDWSPCSEMGSSLTLEYYVNGNSHSDNLEIKIFYNTIIERIKVEGNESLITPDSILKATEICKNYHKKYRMLLELRK